MKTYPATDACETTMTRRFNRETYPSDNDYAFGRYEQLPDSAKWLHALDHEVKDRILAVMREIRSESESALAKSRTLAPRFSEVAVGAGGIDEFVVGEALAVLLGAIAEGYCPLAAAAIAKSFARGAVKLHNVKRPRDANWQRWDQGAWESIERVYWRLSGALRG